MVVISAVVLGGAIVSVVMGWKRLEDVRALLYMSAGLLLMFGSVEFLRTSSWLWVGFLAGLGGLGMFGVETLRNLWRVAIAPPRAAAAHLDPSGLEDRLQKVDSIEAALRASGPLKRFSLTGAVLGAGGALLAIWGAAFGIPQYGAVGLLLASVGTLRLLLAKRLGVMKEALVEERDRLLEGDAGPVFPAPDEADSAT
jgi:hypothetical protein